ncbi:MAG: bifunctional (p)ppGpp synthetase/guanosine-3',5'-bis(diphosphate) 3'-pyrophosphohydrolase [Rickettsiales bacterium]|nr:bifunctional (p)ppGpp synthetase/guanosine-3',5'-bis(diphosphate) 3'-pyrophosphohydrolase [Rickettsiales bacterium]
MESQSDLVNKIKEYNPNVDIERITKAFAFSDKAHAMQKRASGEPYIIHPLSVAGILVELKLDTDSIIAGLLHDTVEDTFVTHEVLEAEFGPDVANLVDGLTKLNKIAYQPDNLHQAENFRKFLLAMSRDIRILLIKIADRLHNMRTLQHVPKAKRMKIAKETLEIYAPLTERIGIHAIKDDLQDLAFKEMHPEVRNSILQRLEYLRKSGGIDIINRNTERLHEIISKHDIPCKVYGREKRPYSIWLKMKTNNISFEQLSDIMAFRVVVSDISLCYQVLGFIHQKFHMVPGTFKDFISTPKKNGYQSLHSTVIGPGQQKIEIQIRTELMHQVAEYGIAAHWSYKQGVVDKNAPYNYYWIKELLHILETSSNIEDFFHNTRMEMYSDQVFCFSPKGELTALPMGSTPVDFAYHIHSEVGNTCMGAKVNSIIVPLRTQLINGDQVDIICSQNQKPSESWEEFVVTGKARSHIKKYFRSIRHQDYIKGGVAILEQYFNEKNMPLNRNNLTEILSVFAKTSLDDLYIAVSEGLVSRADVFKVCYPKYVAQLDIKKKGGFWKRFKFSKKSAPVINKKHRINSDAVKGIIPGLVVSYAGCCYPVPGDRILGVVHAGKGVSIHRSSCTNIKRIVGTENVITVLWNSDDKIKGKFISRIKCIIGNKDGSIAETLNIIHQCSINIDNFRIVTKSDVYIECYIDVEVRNIKDLHSLKASLRSNQIVYTIERFS